MKHSTSLSHDPIVVKAIAELKKVGKSSQIAYKLRAVIAVRKHGITMIAEIFGITRPTLMAWIKHVKNGTIERLYPPPERRRKKILNDTQRQQIREWLQANSQLTIHAVRIKIQEDFGITISKSTVHREMVNLGYSYMKPRPQHFKQNPDQVSDFKKKY